MPVSHRAKMAEYAFHLRPTPPFSVMHPKERALSANESSGARPSASTTSQISLASASRTPQAVRSRGTGGYPLSDAHADAVTTRAATTPRQRMPETIARPDSRRQARCAGVRAVHCRRCDVNEGLSRPRNGEPSPADMASALTGVRAIEGSRPQWVTLSLSKETYAEPTQSVRLVYQVPKK